MRRADGVFRSGLMLFASGRADSARVVWALATDEASRFWRAIAGRAAERAASDSVLATIAARPGYSFYAVAARETLGLSAWPGRVAEDSCGAAGCAVVRAAQALAAAGAGEEALFLIARWAAGDARAGAGGPAPGDLLAASRLAFEMGRPATGTGYAERALRMPAAGPPATQWATTPWAYPPAFGRLLSAAADHAPGLEPALLAALVRQESRFDLRARSARDALGLMQLKLATAREVARELHVAAPSESSLFDPAINVRLGVRYLERLLHRFDGDVVAALCAYNAGPSTLGTAWRSLVERGGDALLCELGANSDARDYAKKILSGRQAYRELRPRSSAGE
jgi:soluble lytic murein transglycosylase